MKGGAIRHTDRCCFRMDHHAGPWKAIFRCSEGPVRALIFRRSRFMPYGENVIRGSIFPAENLTVIPDLITE